MHRVVAPVLQEYEAMPDGAQSSVELPAQTLPFPLIEHVGGWLTTTVLLQVLEQPAAFVTVTE